MSYFQCGEARGKSYTYDMNGYRLVTKEKRSNA